MERWILRIGLLVLGSAWADRSCTKEDHRRCISLADPLLKDPHLIFPDNIEDIDRVCRTWSSFVDCIKSYTEDCLTNGGREQFNAAVQEPIASVHQMCTVSTYQTEYLRHASCMKATITEKEHCGGEYAALVDEVASKASVSKTSICCSHYRFRSCVMTEIRKRCAGDASTRNALTFSRQVLSKALSFLQDQCRNYIPNSGDCPGATTDVTSAATHATGSSRRSESTTTGRFSTLPVDGYTGEASDLYTTLAPSDGFAVTSGGRRANEVTTGQPGSTTGNAQASVRPVSYGRAMSWPPTTTMTTTTTTTTRTTDSPSEIPAWATSSYQSSNQMSTKDEFWYPPAGSFGGNHIDEPNQQGLSKNSQRAVGPRETIVLLATLVFYAL